MNRSKSNTLSVLARRAAAGERVLIVRQTRRELAAARREIDASLPVDMFTVEVSIRPGVIRMGMLTGGRVDFVLAKDDITWRGHEYHAGNGPLTPDMLARVRLPLDDKGVAV